MSSRSRGASDVAMRSMRVSRNYPDCLNSAPTGTLLCGRRIVPKNLKTQERLPGRHLDDCHPTS